MTLTFKEIIARFKEEVADSHPGVTIEQLQVICRSPFDYLLKLMPSPDLPEMRFKYLGTFKADVKKAQTSLDKIHSLYLKGVYKVNEEKYYEETKKLMTYIYKNRFDRDYQKYIIKSKKFPNSIIHKYYNIYGI